MTLTFPRDLLLDLYLGRWVDVTALQIDRSLRQVDPVELNWGSNAEQGKIPPQTLDCVLNNKGGHWTPDNPMSDYYDYLKGRNVPARLSLRVSRDAFSRTIAVGSSWGFTDTLDGWITAGNGFDTYSVGSGVGTMFINGTLAYGIAFLGDSYADCEAAVTGGVLPFVNVIGAPVEPVNLVQRYQSSGAFAGEMYLLRVEIRTDQSVWISIHHSTLGQLVTPVSLTALIGLVHAGSNRIRGKFQAEGQTLRGKAWDAATDEPLGWQVTAHHERLTGGFPGVRSGVATGNTNTKPIQFDYDDWDLRLPRMSGEVQKLEPTWDESHRIKKAKIKVAGISMRLGRPQTPRLKTAIERYVVTSTIQPAAYWPMDDGKLALSGHVAAGAGTPAVLFDGNFADMSVQFPLGSGTVAPWLDPVAEIKNSPVARFAPAVPITGWWTTHYALSHGGGRYSTNANTDGIQIGTSGGTGFTLTFRSFTYEIDVAGPAGPSVGTVTFPGFYDQKIHTIALRAKQNGAATDWTLWIDGGVALSGSIAATTVPTLTRATYSQNGHAEDNRSRALGHVAIYAGDGVDPGAWNYALFGAPGERSLARAIRICTEEKVPLDYWGDPALSPPMGPQRPIKLVDQLQECADVGGDVLFEPRGAVGFSIRGRRSMSARTAVATLDYSRGDVAPPLAPAADDRPTANRITATRTDGGSIVLEQASGPMNTKDPGTDPDAVGVSPADVKVNAQTDAQLSDAGGWARALGTVPDVRYPRVTVDLAARELTLGADPTLPARQLMQLGVGDRFVVANLQAADIYRDLDQIVRGGRETYSSIREHQVTFNTAPYEKYRSGVYGDAASRYDSGGVTTLDAQLTAGTVGGRAITTATGMPWTNAAGAFPLDVVIGGERITISGVTGVGAAQTMTISVRNLNGLPVAGGKTHPAGTRVYLYQPVYYC